MKSFCCVSRALLLRGGCWAALCGGLWLGCSAPDEVQTPTGEPSSTVSPTTPVEGPSPSAVSTTAPGESPTPERPTPPPRPTGTPVPEVTPTAVPTPPATATPTPAPTPALSSWAGLKAGLREPWLWEYDTPGDGGLAHLTYWTLRPGTDAFLALPPEEQEKVLKIRLVNLASVAALGVTEEARGVEVTGTLAVSAPDGHSRVQEVVLKLPTSWNKRLVVLTTSGQFTEFSNETLLTWWLVNAGYAVACGNKGMTNDGADGLATLLNGQHPTRDWGPMVLDLARWAAQNLEQVTGETLAALYVMGHSNGGYLVRKALELDHQATGAGAKRLFSGGLDWSGLYWPDASVLDQNRDGRVTPAEYARGTHLFSMVDGAALAMGYAHAEDTHTNTEEFYQAPPFSSVQEAMRTAGFTSESAPFWGVYNTLFEAALLYGLTNLEGVGYYNLSGYLYRAELRGDTEATSQPYSCYATGDGSIPPYYSYITTEPDAGFNETAVEYALELANTGVFSVPLLTVQGLADGFIGVQVHGQAYAQAVDAAGDPRLYRQYRVEHGAHIDADSDGFLDFDLDGQYGEEGMGEQLTPLQGYVRYAFALLEDWVEAGVPAPASQTLPTDPTEDLLDPSLISF